MDIISLAPLWRLLNKRVTLFACLFFLFHARISQAQELQVFTEGGKKGLKNENNQVVVKAGFDDLFPSSKGIITKLNGKYGLLDVKGIEILMPVFPNSGEIEVAMVMENVMASLKEKQKSLMPAQEKAEPEPDPNDEKLDFAMMLSRPGDEGLIFVRKGVLWGYANQDYKVIIEPQFEEVKRFSGGLGRVKKAGKWGYVDKSGKMVVPAIYESAGDFMNDDWASVQLNGRSFAIDKSGREKSLFTQAKSTTTKSSTSGGGGGSTVTAFVIHVNYERTWSSGGKPGSFMEMEDSMKFECDGKSILTSMAGVDAEFVIIQSGRTTIEGRQGMGYKTTMKNGDGSYEFFFYDLESGFGGNSVLMIHDGSFWQYTSR